MISHIDIANVLFLDVECVSGQTEYQSLSEGMQSLWKKKSAYFLKDIARMDS